MQPRKQGLTRPTPSSSRRWLAGELLLIPLALYGPTIRLSRTARALVVAATLLLVSCVTPFSALPNPLGAYYLLVGGYTYHPHGLIVNRFATLNDGDPSALVTARQPLGVLLTAWLMSPYFA